MDVNTNMFTPKKHVSVTFVVTLWAVPTHEVIKIVSAFNVFEREQPLAERRVTHFLELGPVKDIPACITTAMTTINCL